jgi:hypothetical protein
MRLKSESRCSHPGHRVRPSDEPADHARLLGAARRLDGGVTSVADLSRAVLQTLLARDWAEAEGARRGLRVTDGQVARGLREQRTQAGQSRAAFERSLARLGQTLADARAEARRALLTDRFEAAAVREGRRDDDGDDGAAALARYRAEYAARWRAATTCAAGLGDAWSCGAVATA